MSVPVIHFKEVDFNNFVYEKRKSEPNSTTIVYDIKYKHDDRVVPFKVQTPRMRAPFGISDNAKYAEDKTKLKYVLSLELKDSEDAFYKFLEQFDEANTNFLVKESSAIWGKEKSLESILEDKYSSLIKKYKVKEDGKQYPDKFTLKIQNVRSGKTFCNIYTQNEKKEFEECKELNTPILNEDGSSVVNEDGKPTYNHNLEIFSKRTFDCVSIFRGPSLIIMKSTKMVYPSNTLDSVRVYQMPQVSRVSKFIEDPTEESDNALDEYAGYGAAAVAGATPAVEGTGDTAEEEDEDAEDDE
jgi:hypothetical protein